MSARTRPRRSRIRGYLRLLRRHQPGQAVAEVSNGTALDRGCRDRRSAHDLVGGAAGCGASPTLRRASVAGGARGPNQPHSPASLRAALAFATTSSCPRRNTQPPLVRDGRNPSGDSELSDPPRGHAQNLGGLRGGGPVGVLTAAPGEGRQRQRLDLGPVVAGPLVRVTPAGKTPLLGEAVDVISAAPKEPPPPPLAPPGQPFLASSTRQRPLRRMGTVVASSRRRSPRLSL